MPALSKKKTKSAKRPSKAKAKVASKQVAPKRVSKRAVKPVKVATNDWVEDELANPSDY